MFLVYWVNCWLALGSRQSKSVKILHTVSSRRNRVSAPGGAGGAEILIADWSRAQKASDVTGFRYQLTSRVTSQVADTNWRHLWRHTSKRVSTLTSWSHWSLSKWMTVQKNKAVQLKQRIRILIIGNVHIIIFFLYFFDSSTLLHNYKPLASNPGTKCLLVSLRLRMTRIRNWP